jgi:hypothetical protein
MNPVIVKTLLATAASAFYGASYIAPLPWAFYFLGASSVCIVIMRLLP